MKTNVIFFPFDLFGSAGAGAGAELIADEIREMLADNRRETVVTRARAYNDALRLKHVKFETVGDYETWRRRGRDAARKALAQGDKLIWIAGNHLGALPVYEELAGHDDVLVVQLDAHLDIHNFADCTTELSHGNFLLHIDGTVPVVNVGHRELLLTEEHIAGYYRRTFPASALAADAAGVLDQLRKLTRSVSRVFIDVDCDVFDAAYFPAVSQSAPFGLSPSQVLAVIDATWSERVAGVIFSEFDPARDENDRSLAMVVWLIESMLLRWHE